MSGASHLARRRHSGSSLIEVAISLLLISISTLGLAGLQMSAKQLGHQASQRSEAVTLADNLLERMRVNRGVLPLYAVDGVGAAAGSQLARPLSNCRERNCSAVELSAWDLWEWQGALDGMHTSGSSGGLSGAAACVAVNRGAVMVAISWRINRQGEPQMPVRNDGQSCDLQLPEEDRNLRQSLRLVSFISEDSKQ